MDYGCRGAKGNRTMTESRYLSAAETAKLIRKVLKREFPGVTFSVTSETYSGGASVSIQWVDGPTTKQVDAHVGAFAGKGFDGMIDLSYYKDAWLLPDGTVSPAKSQGSGNSGGMDAPYDHPAPSPDAELVHFGAGYIHTNRHHSPEFVRRVAAEMEAKTGWTAPAILEHDSYWSRSKTVQTAYFENWTRIEDRQNWEEFSQALYLTPGDAPLVTRFDYAFEDEEPEPVPQAAEVAPERTEAEQIEVYRETLAEIAALPEAPGPDPKTIKHEDRAPEEREEVEALWAETARQIEEPEPQADDAAGVKALLLQELRELATEIIRASDSKFVHRCVTRKVAAIGAHTDLATLIQVGDDLTLIAEAA